MKPPRVIHPFLIGLFPVLAIYAHNRHQLEPGVVLLPVAVVLALTALLLALARTFLEPQRAGLLISWFLVLFFSHGHAVGAVQGWLGTSSNRTQTASFAPVLVYATCTLLFSAAFVWVRETTRPLEKATSFLNTFGAIVVGIVVLHVLYVGLKDALRPMSPRQEAETNGVLHSQAGPSPDIYFVVLDGYGRADVLKEIYGFDSQKFLDELARMGFSVGEKSRANYIQSGLSLASTLNMAYIEDLLDSINPDSSNRRPLAQLIKENRSVRFLKRHGYRTIAFASGDGLAEMNTADVFVTRPFIGSLGFNEFQAVLLDTTPVSTIWEALLRTDSEYEHQRRRILTTLETLPAVARLEGPKFVFAHVIAPHPPFVFGRDGEPVRPKRSYSGYDGSYFMDLPGASPEEYRTGYVRQVEFVTRKVLDALAGIMRNSRQPPIVILQSDHGPGLMLDWEDPGRSNLRERFGILSAHFYPGAERDVPPPVTPVNTFRLVFQRYFGTPLEMLPDKSYFSTWSRPYRFLRVTCDVDACAPADATPGGEQSPHAASK